MLLLVVEKGTAIKKYHKVAFCQLFFANSNACVNIRHLTSSLSRTCELQSDTVSSMENIYPIEHGNEKIEKETVIEMLRLHGFDHPETKNLVLEWTLQQEEFVAKENTSKASIVFNIERSDLYLAVGDILGALECLDDAYTQALHEDEVGLCQEIQKKREEILGEN